MKKLVFTQHINAPKEKIWPSLWEDKNYREWTRVFQEGSHAVSDWKLGSKVHFLAGNNGMYSEIVDLIPNEYMSFRHIGNIKDGVEMPVEEETAVWSGSHENYRLISEPGGVRLEAELETTEDWENMFNDLFPKALAIVKDIAER